MRARLLKFIRAHSPDDAGEIAIDIIIKMMLTFFLIYIILQVMPILTIHTNLSHVANDLARTVELTGQLDSEEYQRQMEAYNTAFPFMAGATITIEPDDPLTGWFSAAQRKFAFRAPFTLRMEYTYEIDVINPTLTDAGLSIPITISKVVYGTSEIYWKD